MRKTSSTRDNCVALVLGAEVKLLQSYCFGLIRIHFDLT